MAEADTVEAVLVDLAVAADLAAAGLVGLAVGVRVGAGQVVVGREAVRRQ